MSGRMFQDLQDALLLVSAELLGQLKPGTVVRCGQLFSEDVW